MIEPIHLGLNRPQYVSSPETLISALAWRAFPVNVPDQDGKAVGLRFRSEEAGTSTLTYRATAPNREALDAFGVALSDAGIAGEANSVQLASAIEMSVRGVAAAGGKSQAVSPLTPALALLQNPRGMMGSRNPPDIAEILEQMYALGRVNREDITGASATQQWLTASRFRLGRDALLNAVDVAAQKILLPAAGIGDGGPLAVESELSPTKSLPYLGIGTPFSWFRVAWDRLTSPEWVEALPPRVWVDWATTVLRLAYGMGFLWESLRYESLARAIVSEGAIPAARAGTRHTVLPWRSSKLSVGDRDIAPLLISRAHRAERIRQYLLEYYDEDSSVAELSRDAKARASLQLILTSNETTRSGKNLWEASRYALMTRAVGGDSADYYGFLRAHGRRFLAPEPGTEWIAVIASLACGSPSSSTTVHRVLSDLSGLGMRPELGDLIDLLERSGLSRGSADADQALIVQSAY